MRKAERQVATCIIVNKPVPMCRANYGNDLCWIDNAFLDCLAETRDITRVLQAEPINICAHIMPSGIRNPGSTALAFHSNPAFIIHAYTQKSLKVVPRRLTF